MRIIGIDPGLTGAIAWLNENEKPIALMMPITAKKVDVYQIYENIPFHCNAEPDLVVIEEPSPFPAKFKQGEKAVFGGAVTNFRMGERLGELRAICAIGKWPFLLVKPMTWKSKLFHGQNWHGDKSVAIRYVQQLYPSFEIPPAKYKAEAMCEALCIAEYGRQYHLRQQEPF